MEITVAKLQEMAQGHGLRVIERGAGHFQILDGTCLVNYYPNGKRRTAYIEGAPGKGQHGVTPEQAFQMALGPLPAGMRKAPRMRCDGLDDPAKRSPADWIALLPGTRYAWRRDEFNERIARDRL